jgi:diketogulonate reductase-like aldo/keto reductase
MKYQTLNSGYKMPVVGTGTNTFGKENHDFNGMINYDTTELLSAIRNGYRLIDTAIMYRNEAVIGKSIKESGIDRKEFFITTKIPTGEEYIKTDELIKTHIERSFDLLSTDYIDLYLIHFPTDSLDDNLRIWSVMESYVKKGRIHSIGVSNFNIKQLSHLINHASIRPAVNQFQSYPGNHQQELIDYCKEHHIVPEAYHSLAKIGEETKLKLIEVSKKYNKTWNQIILNYQINEGLVVIPKSHKSEHQLNNMEIFDFSLTDSDKIMIKNL